VRGGAYRRIASGAAVWALALLVPSWVGTAAANAGTAPPLLVAGSNTEGAPAPREGAAATSGSLDLTTRPAVMADGSLLVIEHPVVRRIAPDGIIRTVAGLCCEQGVSGDGGPAAKAQLGLPGDLAASADGGFLIADRTGRVRRVWPDGRITTVAGTARTAELGDPVGDAGPAALTSLGRIDSIAAAPGGGFFFGETRTVFKPSYRAESRLRHVGRGGVITTVTLVSSSSLSVQDDGGVLFTSGGEGRETGVERLAPDGSRTTLAACPRSAPPPLCAVAAAPGGGFVTVVGRRVVRVDAGGSAETLADLASFDSDFAGRGIGEVKGLAVDAHGVYLSTAEGVWLVPFGPPRRAAVRIVDARRIGGRLRVQVRATPGGVLTVRAGRESRRARAHGPTQWLSVRTRGASRASTVVVTLRGRNGIAVDRLRLVVGPRLPMRLARASIEFNEIDDEGGLRTGPCRRFGPRRIDCQILGPGRRCTDIISLSAGRDGILQRRDYRCHARHPRFRSKPRWNRPAEPYGPSF
jgi:hypothetical protein